MYPGTLYLALFFAVCPESGGPERTGVPPTRASPITALSARRSFTWPGLTRESVQRRQGNDRSPVWTTPTPSSRALRPVREFSMLCWSVLFSFSQLSSTKAQDLVLSLSSFIFFDENGTSKPTRQEHALINSTQGVVLFRKVRIHTLALEYQEAVA